VIILTHRGYWDDPTEKNKTVAFQKSFASGLGTETDVRDLNGRPVIAHDVPRGGELPLADLLHLLAGRDLPLAVNVKADGLATLLLQEMLLANVRQWFTFDMSIPETVLQLRLGLPAFTRASEYEYPPPLYDRAHGVWLDAFDDDWYSPRLLEDFLRDGKRVCIVSPELHGRAPEPLWGILRTSHIARHPRLMLCTDRPADARAWFQSDGGDA
jgi:hypothetical protein